MRYTLSILSFLLSVVLTGCRGTNQHNVSPRQIISINEGWRFMKYASRDEADDLIYDEWPEITNFRDDRPADEKPTEAAEVKRTRQVLKPWIMPTGNDFLSDTSSRFTRPKENPGVDHPFVQSDFDDSGWEMVDLPHDWAIGGPFYGGRNALVGGGMGRLPSPGVAWYRKKIDIPASDAGKSVFLQVDGAMSYAMVWVNGYLAGGWPYGYASWQVDLTPYLQPGGDNQLAIRLDNPPNSSRWYPGGGLYRNLWLIKTAARVHVAPWGTAVKTRNISAASATVDVEVTVKNDTEENVTVGVSHSIFAVDVKGNKAGRAVTSIESKTAIIPAGEHVIVRSSADISNPRLWGPPPNQEPNRYVVVTTLVSDGIAIDEYSTLFGIRSVTFDADSGVFVNGEHIYLKGANQHHDLGALGAAFNLRAAERQLEMLREMGCNAIRMAHNPPAPELLDLTDRMGFLVIDEIFDSWERRKTPLDFHLIFPEWYEQDLRAFIRRDRNHPSVIAWSIGNEVGEQYTDEAGAFVAHKLHDIAKDEDPSRPTITAMNYAKPNMPFPAATDLVGLNYQGEGIRDAPGYEHLRGIRTPPLYPAFHGAFPDKVIISTENAAAVSSRGTYLFPVTPGISAPVSDGVGGDGKSGYVSAYELYTAPFGSSADKVLASLARHPYVAGGFVWSGWDYLGEPTPFYSARSSYFGVIDLAGFKKDRFYLYQAAWRPDLKMAHMIPHWTWPDRVGAITPVHVFTSGDEAELFLNGRSMGRKRKAAYEYRLRWDSVRYEPGEIKVVAYKDGEEWATAVRKTAGEPAKLKLSADRNVIHADGQDLSFITVEVLDANNVLVPNSSIPITFEISGPGVIVATDNGDPTDLTSFHSHTRKAFGGLSLAIVKGTKGQKGEIQVRATSGALRSEPLVIKINP